MASTKLTRTFTAGNRKTYTISLWVKRCGLYSSPNYQALFVASGGDDGIFFKNDNTLDCFFHSVEKRTNRVFRDTNAWYHIMVAVDTTQASASNRLKIYVNGEQETSFAYNSGDPAQDSQNKFNKSGGTNVIGNHSSSSYNFDGVMSHIHYCDGTALAPTVFGSTDSTTGEWKINTSPSFTPGTNGFTILKDGNTITDQSANSNNFTLASGTLTKTEDCPSNVFATFNPLCARTQIVGSSNVSYTNGNTTVTNTDSSYSSYNVSTLGMQGSGKYYCEFKLNTLGGSSDSERFGISNLNDLSNYPFGSSSGYSYNKDGNATPSGSGFPTYTTNDIIGVAFDAGNGNMWFSKNGTWINSATISEIAAGTTTNAVFTGISTSETWHFSAAAYSNGSISVNFGNGYFGTTAVSSAGTNASGNGIFEYDVPTGYTALSTKGLNE